MTDPMDFLRELVDRGGPKQADYEPLQKCFSHLWNQTRGSNASAQAEVDRVRKVLAPTLTLQSMQGFALLKPHGYAGDYEILERIYHKWLSPDVKLRHWDEYFHAQQTPKAVKNRKDYFQNVLADVECKHTGHQLRVLNFGSGPGRDMFEYLSRVVKPRIHFHCVDIDKQAIEFAGELNRNFSANLTFHYCPSFWFRPDESYHLVWAGGLFDYFNDRQFKVFLKHLFSLVAPGGEFVLGNFTEPNPTRPYMELVGDWYIEYREEEHLRNLAIQAGINPQDIHTRREAQGLNIFLHLRNPG